MLDLPVEAHVLKAIDVPTELGHMRGDATLSTAGTNSVRGRIGDQANAATRCNSKLGRLRYPTAQSPDGTACRA